MSASPKKHGMRQPVIKLTASSATSNSPVARALFQLETQGMSPEMHCVCMAAVHFYASVIEAGLNDNTAPRHVNLFAI